MAWVVVIAALVGYLVVSVVSAGGLLFPPGTHTSSRVNTGMAIERPFLTKGEIAATLAPWQASFDWFTKIQATDGSTEMEATLHVGFHDPANVVSQTLYRVGWPVEVAWCRVTEMGDLRSHTAHPIQLRRPENAVLGATFLSTSGYVSNWSTPGGLTQRMRLEFQSLLAFVPIFLVIFGFVLLIGRVALTVGGWLRRPPTRNAMWWQVIRCLAWAAALLVTLGLMVFPQRLESTWPLGPGGGNFTPLDTGLTRDDLLRLSQTEEGRERVRSLILAAPGRDDFVAQFLYLFPSDHGVFLQQNPAILGSHIHWTHLTHADGGPTAARPLHFELNDGWFSTHLPRAAGGMTTTSLSIRCSILEPIGELCLFALVVFGVCAAPGWWLSRRDRRRVARGLCVGCGYDLAGLREMKES